MGRQEDLLDEIERFVAAVRDDERTGSRPCHRHVHRHRRVDRKRPSSATRMGDLVEQHHGVVRAMLGRFRGTG
jgi:hypothetical protein